ncbi:MAG: MBL fold metallo-hydrolase [Oscillospiraceae bacterium]|jgi:metallo-beta-lactamase family protein|nr:MBL fold metallo-hydrolase [Oscillospiraceae bacterium]
MRITFLGATHEVTGSCTLIETLGKHFLVDCGMEQGPDIFVNQAIPVSSPDIDCVFLTHAHIDHSGKLPLLSRNGFKGKIYATEETVNLCRIMLLDSANIQEFEAEWRNRKAKRSGLPPYEPLYTAADAQAAVSGMLGSRYGELRQVSENVSIRFSDMGHLLGSAAIEVWITEDGVTKKIVFSGDVGNRRKPILRSPQSIDEADYLVVESTYGDGLHETAADTLPVLVSCLQRTFDRGGNVVIPSFAVGRTQELLYYLRKIKDQGLVRGHAGFPVYVDSPLANEATAIFLQSNPEVFDDEIRAMFRQGINPLVFPDLKMSVSTDESKAINFDETPKVIISASGMCEAGRIRHHLKHNLWRKESLILFAGYQSNGTLGRILLDGAKEVRLFGETIRVEAELYLMPGMSGHADKAELIEWIGGFKKKPGLVFINHGEDEVMARFSELIRSAYALKTAAPYSGTCYDLITGQPVLLTEGIPVGKKADRRDERAAGAFARLIAACEKLLRVARSKEGAPNKTLGKFAGQVDQLADRWSR